MIRQSLLAYGEPLAETQGSLPEPKGSEVLMRVTSCGVCHSDLHLQDGFFDLGEGKRLDIRLGRKLPFTLGHEISGHVESAGPDAEDFDRSAFYAIYPWCGCGSCERCCKGQEHLCDAPRQLGITVDGGYASHVLVPGLSDHLACHRPRRDPEYAGGPSHSKGHQPQESHLEA